MSDTPTIEELRDFVPLAERAIAADRAAFIRFRRTDEVIAGFVGLPYDVVAGRTVAAPATAGLPSRVDVTYAVLDFLDWAGRADDTTGPNPAPTRRDAHWLGALPPRTGWQRVELVPGEVIRDLVQTGADLARGVTARAEQDSLLASTVLTVTSQQPVEVPLRALAALTSMGFLPDGSSAGVDEAPGWIRIAAPYGSTFIAKPSGLFNLL
jgi:hypothetical protein